MNKIKIEKIVLFTLFSVCMISCQESIAKTKSKKQHVTKDSALKIAAEKERASFDKLPDHNDSIVGYWSVDKGRSVKMSTNYDIDAFFFDSNLKRLTVIDTAVSYISEERIGFFRFYNNELTMEITEEDKPPFQHVWSVKMTGNKMIAHYKKNKEAFLYLTKTTKEGIYKRP